MSSLIWDQDNIVQRVRDNVEELGHVKYDKTANEYVLWLRDTRDVFGINKGYVRGDTFSSMADAKRHAAQSTSARLFHYMWLVGLRHDRDRPDKEIDKSIENAHDAKPLTESTFKEEMKKGKRRGYWMAAFGVVMAILVRLLLEIVL